MAEVGGTGPRPPLEANREPDRSGGRRVGQVIRGTVPSDADRMQAAAFHANRRFSSEAALSADSGNWRAARTKARTAPSKLSALPARG